MLLQCQVRHVGEQVKVQTDVFMKWKDYHCKVSKRVIKRLILSTVCHYLSRWPTKSHFASHFRSICGIEMLVEFTVATSHEHVLAPHKFLCRTHLSYRNFAHTYLYSYKWPDYRGVLISEVHNNLNLYL